PEETADEDRLAQTTLGRIREGVFALDREWRFTYVNAEAARQVAMTPEQLLGRNIWTVFPEAVDQPFHRAFDRAMKDQVSVTVEAFVPAYRRWFENRVHPSPEGLTILSREVSAQVREREELE